MVLGVEQCPIKHSEGLLLSIEVRQAPCGGGGGGGRNRGRSRGQQSNK